MEKIEIKIEVKTSCNIWNGEKVPPILTKDVGNKIIINDIDYDWFAKLPLEKQKEYIYKDINEFKLNPIRKIEKKYEHINLNRKEIILTLKTKKDNIDVPYIPGSVIKGYFKTAILWKYLKQNVSEINNLTNYLRKVLDPKKRNINKILFREIDNVLFRGYDSNTPIIRKALNDLFEIYSNKRNLLIKDMGFSDCFSQEKINFKVVPVEIYSFSDNKHIFFKKPFSPLVIEAFVGEFYGNLFIPEDKADELLEIAKKYFEWCVDREIELCKLDRITPEIKKYSENLKQIKTTANGKIGIYAGSIYKTIFGLIEEHDPYFATELINLLSPLRRAKYKNGGKRKVKNNKVWPPYPKTIKMEMYSQPLGIINISII